MPTIEQIRAARALIGWSQSDLADKAELSQTGIARIENGTNQPNSTTLDKIRTAFDKADIEFIDDTGVKKRTGEIKKFRGQTGLKRFMDDVYESAKSSGGKMSFYNIVPENWLRALGKEWWEAHVVRMSEHNDKTDIKIIIPEGNNNFISENYANYKWFPQGFELKDRKSLYVYGGKLGFVEFGQTKEDIEITLLENRDFAEGVQVMFDIAWDHVAKSPTR